MKIIKTMRKKLIVALLMCDREKIEKEIEEYRKRLIKERRFPLLSEKAIKDRVKNSIVQKLKFMDFIEIVED